MFVLEIKKARLEKWRLCDQFSAREKPIWALFIDFPFWARRSDLHYKKTQKYKQMIPARPWLNMKPIPSHVHSHPLSNHNPTDLHPPASSIHLHLITQLTTDHPWSVFHDLATFLLFVTSGGWVILSSGSWIFMDFHWFS